jgi:ribose 5-phosphate isomerase RpiB
MAEEGKVFIGSDHAGFELKERLKKYMADKAIPYEDMGNLRLEPGDDYPDYAEKGSRDGRPRRARLRQRRGCVHCGQ